jgi:formate hydrogenlyase subunit 4
MKVDALVEWALSMMLAPLVVGLIHFAKARLQGRQGPSPMQPYRDLWKLAGKRSVWPETASLVFGLAPYAMLIIYALLLGLVVSVRAAPGDASGDLLTLIFLLALGRFVIGLASLDTGTPLAALGGSRAMFLHMLIEPAMVALACAFALSLQSLQLEAARGSGAVSSLARLLFGGSLLGVILLEAGRLPFDNPEAHLELTMIDKAIELDYSGPELAALEWAGAIRLTFFILLLSFVVFPPGIGGPSEILRFAVYPIAAMALAVWETTRPKYRLRGMITPAFIPLVLALGAILFGFIHP